MGTITREDNQYYNQTSPARDCLQPKELNSKMAASGRQSQLVMYYALHFLFGNLSKRQHGHRDMANSDAAPERERSPFSSAYLVCIFDNGIF